MNKHSQSNPLYRSVSSARYADLALINVKLEAININVLIKKSNGSAIGSTSELNLVYRYAIENARKSAVTPASKRINTI